MTTTRPTGTAADIYHALAEMFPNAEAYLGGGGPLGACLEWEDGYIVLTHEGTHIALGIYAADGWLDGDDDPTIVEVPTVAAALHLVDCLTDLQPEGTDWSAWAAQWLADRDTEAAPGHESAAIAADARAMISAIADDIAHGPVPADVPTFAALHEYVDANDYFAEADGPSFSFDSDRQGWLDWANRTADLVDVWIRVGLARRLGEARKVAAAR